jgi:hypothetical protein
MKLAIAILGTVFIASILPGCAHPTGVKQIITTSTKIIAELRTGDSVQFEAMMDNNLGIIQRNSIPHDVALLKGYLQKYRPDQDPPIEITHLFNTNGQMLVKIHIFNDSANPVGKNGDLRLLFGPTNLAPLSKITGYEMWGDDRFDSTHYHTYSYWHR